MCVVQQADSSTVSWTLPVPLILSFAHPKKILPWLMACGFSELAAAQEPAPARAFSIGEVMVSGSRSEQAKEDVPATVEIITREQIEFEQIHDIRDLARNIPNVSVRRAPARFGLASGSTGRDGNAGFNIRGLDGNRVLLMTDGIRMPRSYVFSSNAFGRDYFDLGLIERVEIVKGPASALYGSDGLAGLVNFITRSPDSFLGEGKSFGGSATIGYSGDNDGWNSGVTLAGKAGESLSWLLSANGSRQHELENMGENHSRNSDRTAPNPERTEAKSLLGKLIYAPNASLVHDFSYEHVDRSSAYDLLSGLSTPPFNANSVRGLGAFTTLQRDRLTWDGRLKLGSMLADNLIGYLSYQKSNSQELAWEDRYTAADRMRDVIYQEDSWQAGLQADKTLRLPGAWSQRITYGIDYSNTQVKNLQTGIVPPAGEVYPLKRFPDTTEKTAAFYLQDEFIHEQWSITPGVRFDHFEIDADQAGFVPRAASLSDSAVSPKLGVLYRATPHWTLYGNFASGFKAPNAFQINNAFDNLIQGYRTLPNPDLKPEKSRNFELGTRGRIGLLRYEAAAFTGDYRDLIENDRQIGGMFGSRTNPATFQSVNIGRARIHGFEFSGELDWTRNGSGFSLPFAYGQTKGEDRSNGRPLNSIQPQKLSLGLQYRQPQWSLRLDAVHHAAKKANDVDATEVPTGVQFLSPSATTLDINAQWRIRRDLRLNLALINLTDKKYWMWSDVRGLTATSPVIDAYTQPGRSFNVSLVADF